MEIVVAAGLIPLAVFGCFFIGLVLLVFVSRKTHDDPFILVLRCDSQETESLTRELLQANVQKLVLKSKNVRPGAIELHYELRLKDEDTSFLHQLAETSGVTETVLVSYNGDYVG